MVSFDIKIDFWIFRFWIFGYLKNEFKVTKLIYKKTYKNKKVLHC
jgi:hypothetical protein